MNQEQVFQEHVLHEFTALPLEAQKQVVDFRVSANALQTNTL